MKNVLKTIAAMGILSLIVSGAAMAQSEILLPDPAFAPEGIAVDSAGSLYVGSLTQGQIVRINSDSKQVEDFVPPGANGMVSTIGLHATADRLYACSSDPGASVRTKSAPSALLAFDRATGANAGRYELPNGGAFCNDITELPDGTILATDSFVPRIYALHPGSKALTVWFESDKFAGEGFNLNGIAYDDGAIYVLRYQTGTLHRIAVQADGTAGEVADIALPKPATGADGLTALGNGRFLIVSGGGLTAGARGALLGVKVEGGAATMEVIASDLNVPTTVAVKDNAAYVVEGQLDHLFDPSAGPADPYRILVLDLPQDYRSK
ncbi:hypothetical protein [Rhizobium rhizosphaerae]|uniref:SMP-30/Gluconolactonase/LRE-like region domain-containing protein n=1 Tax=Xaviernesmea rhizosphaerae TaxID=1672749 RepID=A0ABX3P968_9HYPH|nr:hypothetical protein [Xaviernesmea rhizosphaerae]OQP84477.1 hypothetical protein BTR14_19050 [Xaviernesmea rhizosphaerae]